MKASPILNRKTNARIMMPICMPFLRKKDQSGSITVVVRKLTSCTTGPAPPILSAMACWACRCRSTRSRVPISGMNSSPTLHKTTRTARKMKVICQ